MGKRIKNARLALRLIPRPESGPKLIERAGVVRPAPGVALNTVASPCARTTEKGATEAPGAGLPTHPHPPSGPRFSEFLKVLWGRA